MLNEKNLLDAEITLLGSILIGGTKRLKEAEETGLRPSMFATERYRTIFRAMQEQRDKNDNIDIITLVHDLEKGGDDFRGTISDMLEITPTDKMAAVYAGYIVEDWKRRKLSELVTEVFQYGVQDSGETFDKFRSLRESLDNGTSSGMVITPKAGNAAFSKRLRDGFSGKIPSISTGFRKLDKTISGGLHGGAVYVLAGRTGEGKTTFGIQIANNVAMSGVPVLYVSLEMSPEMINAKRIARYVRRSANDILFGGSEDEPERNLTDAQKEKAVYYADKVLPGLPWYTNVSMSITPADIGQMARGIDGLGLIVVDHIGLLSSGLDGSASRTAEMVKITRDLKILAISLDVPILEMCQFNRAAVQSDKDGKPARKPTMADLKDSSSIEQDADVVWILERVFYGKNRNSDDVIKIRATKNRHGRVGGVSFFRADLALDDIKEIDQAEAERIAAAPEGVDFYG